MRSLRRFTGLLLVLLLVFVPDFVSSQASAESNNDKYTEFLSLSGNGFVGVAHEKDSFDIFTADSDISSSCHIRERAWFSCAGDKYLLIALSQQIPQPLVIFCPDNSVRTVFLTDFRLKQGCLTSDPRGRIYAADENEPDIVRVYSSSGNEIRAYKLQSDVRCLFCSGGTVFALHSDGITDVSKSCFIACKTPEKVVSQSDGYLGSADGSLYQITQNGLELILSTGYDGICRTSSGKTYAYRGSVIFELDDEGEAVRYKDTGGRIEKLLASGKKAAYISGEKLTLIDDSTMDIPETIPPESSTESSIEVSRTERGNKASVAGSERPDSSASEKRSAPKENTSSESTRESSDSEPDENLYITKGGYITGIEPGTSIAQFRKHFDYDGYNISFTDHHGRNAFSGTIGTGWKIHLESSRETLNYTAIVRGDITGEGKCNSRDEDRLSDHLLSRLSLSETEILAADMDKNGIINICDLYLM